ncbi:MAG TPA: hypothetical protein VL832_18175 [Puia sp.]|nr:hypothetical protein [Puia sp.]
MHIPERHRGPAELAHKKARANRRRLVILMVVIFVVVLSFFAGRHSGRKPFINQDATSSQATDPSGKEGIPPDSLHH